MRDLVRRWWASFNPPAFPDDAPPGFVRIGDYLAYDFRRAALSERST